MTSPRTSHVGAAALLLAGLLATPAHAAGDAAAGAPVYDKNCSQCHGTDGAADGPAAAFVLPRPRIFKGNSSYKFRTTPSGELPTDQDLYNIIVRGIPGTSMPSFGVLSENDRWNVVAHLKTFAADFSDPAYTATAIPSPDLASPKPIPTSEASVARGLEVFETNKCAQCHGVNGRGNGVSWVDLTDDWNNVVLPADLTNPDHFRGGHEPFDIFRTVTTGFNGTPMPAYGDAIPIEDRWHLVNYVLSLGPEHPSEKHEVVVARRFDAAPTSGDDPAWDAAPVARFRTLANIIEPPRLYWPTVEFVDVQAAFDGSDLALRVRWNDRSQSTGTNRTTAYADRDGTIHHLTDHPDQFTVQFPAKTADVRRRPYFLHGDAKRPACLWTWQSDRAEALIEQVAKGFSAVSDQDAASQGLTGTVTWDDGRYTMLVRRSLTTPNTKSDPQFTVGGFVPIAFSAWDGARGELGNRRAVTTWYWIYLEPPVPMAAYLAPVVAFAGMFGLLVLIALALRVQSARAARVAAEAAPSA